MGFTQSFQSLGWVIYPFLGGLLAQGNLNLIFYSAAGFFGIAFLLLLIKSFNQKRIV
jgi:hypothetical protein